MDESLGDIFNYQGQKTKKMILEGKWGLNCRRREACLGSDAGEEASDWGGEGGWPGRMGLSQGGHARSAPSPASGLKNQFYYPAYH